MIRSSYNNEGVGLIRKGGTLNLFRKEQHIVGRSVDGNESSTRRIMKSPKSFKCMKVRFAMYLGYFICRIIMAGGGGFLGGMCFVHNKRFCFTASEP